MIHKLVVTAVFSATVVTPWAKTWAQEQTAEDDYKDDEQIEQITVTANKRSSTVQETPLAVSAFTQDNLDRAQVKDLSSLQSLVPNLSIEQHGDSGGVHVFLRGVGSTNHTELGDPAVAFHVDGIYAPRPQGATVLMYDLAHVEIARGPQGTLFGRNATAGSVNLVTAKPVLGQASGSTSMVFGDYNRQGIQGVLNMPLTDTMALRVAAINERHDGYIDFQSRSNVMPGSRKYMAADQTGARGTFLWEPTVDFTLTAAVENYRDHGTGNVALMQKPRAGEKHYSALIDTPGSLDQSSLTYRGRIDYRLFQSVELSYIGSWNRLERKNASDQDAGTLPGFKQEHRTEWSRFDNDSHELQIKSIGDGDFQWIAGAFTIKEDNRIRFDIDIAQIDPPPGQGPIVVYPVQDSDTAWAMSFIQPKRILESEALYGQVSYSITEHFRLTAGARHTIERKEDIGGRNWVCPDFGATIGSGGRLIGPGGVVDETTCNSAYAPGTWPGGGANDGKVEDEATTYLVRTEFDPSPGILTYATVSTGFKSGGLSDGGRRHKPEFITNYELGFKSELLDRRLSLNVAAFVMNYEDMQVSAIEYQPNGQQQLVTSNAAEATIQGIETELSWRINRHNRLAGHVSLLEAVYGDFTTCDSALLDCDDPQNVVNLKGNSLPHAPKVSLSAVYEYDFVWPSTGMLTPRVQANYRAKTYMNGFNSAPTAEEKPGSFSEARMQDAYTTADLSLLYQSATANWYAEAFVLNVTDETIKTDASWLADSSTWTAFYNPPRTFGVKLGYEFF
ncbi:MAG: TonB-dependent receptor [Oligoflexus sp.]